MPGYHLASLDKNVIDAKYLCSSCESLLRDAMQTTCGHFYCQSCLPNLIGLFTRDQQTPSMVCFKDQTSLHPNEVFPDKFIRREVLALVVHCTFKEDGCVWKGEVRHLESHMNTCEFLKIPCVYPECDMLIKKSDLTSHLENECMFRQEKCTFCQRQIVLSRIKQHQDTECPAYPSKCEKCNKDGIPRGKLRDHQDFFYGDCESAQGPCPFSQIGCPKADVLNRKQKKQHLEKVNAQHTDLLLQFAIRMSQEVEAIVTCNPSIMSVSLQLQIMFDELRSLKGKLEENSGRITTLERSLVSGTTSGAASSEQRVPNDASLSRNEHTRRFTNIDNGTTDHEVPLVENNRAREEVRRDVDSIRRQLDTTQESTRRPNRRFEYIERTLALINVNLADLEECVRQQEISSYDGQLLWKISHFSRKRNGAVTGEEVSVDSPSFSTSRYGYKLCARVYLNGDGMGRGTHISVYLVVMRGQYDAILRWPFRLMVTFMLLDQDNLEHVIDTFRPDPNSSSFQRPRRETNIGSGCPMFCSLAELDNHAYVRDDAMFLKIIVDTSDL